MNFEAFIDSLFSPEPPLGMGELLKALWYEGKGDWEKAHEITQEANTPDHCLIHAYLHRKEGDNWNANYWYNRAKKEMPQLSLRQEWELLVKTYLARETA